MKLCTDILTGIDNRTYDGGRVLSLLSFLAYFVLAFASMYHHHYWTAMDFAGGVGTMAVGFGANLRLKQSTEPQGDS